MIREKFFFYPSKIELNINTDFYKKFRNIFIFGLIFIILFVCFVNFNFQIYQRGLVGNSYHFLFSGFIKTSLLYFLSLCIAFILFFDLASYKRVFFLILLLLIFETFLSSISMLSRGMIFNCLAITFALYKFTNKINLKLQINFYLKFLALLFLAFYISVISVNHLRISKFNIGGSLINENSLKYSENKASNIKITQNISQSFNGFYHLLIHRWVGINSMLIITEDKKFLNFELFYQSLNEKYDAKSISFYEKNFNIYPEDNYKANSSRKGNTLPGLIAFLFYSGSYIFLFFQ